MSSSGLLKLWKEATKIGHIFRKESTLKIKDSTNFRQWKMTLKLRILRSLTRLFTILISLTRLLFNEKMLISNRCICGLMPNMIKKSWTVSTIEQSKVIAEFVKNDQMATRGHLFSTTTNKSEIQSKLTIFNLASKQGGIFWPISELFLELVWHTPPSLKKDWGSILLL